MAKKIKQYKKSEISTTNIGEYVRIEDIKEFLPPDFQIIRPVVAVYTYLLENKQDKVLALKKQYDVAIAKSLKPKKFSLSFEANLSLDGEADWDGNMTYLDLDTNDALEKMESRLDYFVQEAQEVVTEIVQEFREKLVGLYSDMIPSVSLYNQELGELAWAVFDNPFDEKTGSGLNLYSSNTQKTKKSSAKSTKTKK
jgi:hypothetical protein